MRHNNKQQKKTSTVRKATSTHSLMRKNKPWTHLELGAANYGNRHTTFFNLFPYATAGHDSYKVLYLTIDELTKRKGNHGVIFLNDLDSQLVEFVTKALKKYLSKNYKDNKITIKPLVGNFFTLRLPMFDSIHLKNPEYSFFNALSGENISRLKYFAEHSKEGLTLTTYCIPTFLEKVEELGIGYQVLDYNHTPYIHSDGYQINSEGKVIKFSIKSLDTIAGRLRSHTPSSEEAQTILQSHRC